MSSSLVQVRVDDQLKNAAANIYNRLGMDLSTAVKIFLKRSVLENGMPFSMHIGYIPSVDNVRSHIPADITNTLDSMAQSAKEFGADKMTLSDINAEISAVREAR